MIRKHVNASILSFLHKLVNTGQGTEYLNENLPRLLPSFISDVLFEEASFLGQKKGRRYLSQPFKILFFEETYNSLINELMN